jgi:signal-transduction protein with cAMP-binding, CBS, and nucleotidyltransferase domain
MASGGDCVLRSATQIPSLHCSGLERLGDNWTVATKSAMPSFWAIPALPAFSAMSAFPRVWKLFSLNIGLKCGRFECSVPQPMEVTGIVSRILERKGSSSVWWIAPEAMVYEAIKMMAQKNIGALVVLENNRLVGIISERDYTRKVILQGKSSKETPVREIMTQELITAEPNDNIGACMRLMTERRVRHLPVMEGSKLIGVVSIGDLLKWLISEQDAAIDHLERYITGSYPA